MSVKVYETVSFEREMVPAAFQETGQETRPPKLTQHEAAFLLARGPYVARLAAQEKLLAYAKSITTMKGEYGPDLPGYVIEELAGSVEVARQELAEFDAVDQSELVAETGIEAEETTAPVSTQALGQSVVGHTVALSLVDKRSSDWRERALCSQTDPEAFHPEKGGSTKAAKKVCESCDVREECLQWALDTNERFGIWGGLSERERRKLSKKAS